MNAAVLKALEKAQKQLEKTEREERDSLALYFNLYKRVYAPDGKFSDEYPFYSQSDTPTRYFRKAPNTLTDEEYAALAEMKRKLENAAASVTVPADNGRPEGGRPTALIPICYGIGGLILLIALIVCFNIRPIFGYAMDAGWVILCVAVAGGAQAVLWFAIGKIMAYLHTIAVHTAIGSSFQQAGGCAGGRPAETKGA